MIFEAQPQEVLEVREQARSMAQEERKQELDQRQQLKDRAARGVKNLFNAASRTVRSLGDRAAVPGLGVAGGVVPPVSAATPLVQSEASDVEGEVVSNLNAAVAEYFSRFRRRADFVTGYEMYKEYLSSIPLPTAAVSSAQADKDVQREKLLLNGVPVSGHRGFFSRTLRKVLSTLPLEREILSSKFDVTAQRRQFEQGSGSNPKPGSTSGAAGSAGATTAAPAYPPKLRQSRSKYDDGYTFDSKGRRVKKKRTKPLNVDKIAQQILERASRTTTGADSYFVVHHIFQDTELLLKPRRGVHPPIEITVWPTLSGKQLITEIKCVNLYGLYSMDDIDAFSTPQENGVHGAHDEPPPWMEVDTTVVDRSNFDTGYNRRALAVVLRAPSHEGPVPASGSDDDNDDGDDETDEELTNGNPAASRAQALRRASQRYAAASRERHEHRMALLERQEKRSKQKAAQAKTGSDSDGTAEHDAQGPDGDDDDNDDDAEEGSPFASGVVGEGEAQRPPTELSEEVQSMMLALKQMRMRAMLSQEDDLGDDEDDASSGDTSVYEPNAAPAADAGNEEADGVAGLQDEEAAGEENEDEENDDDDDDDGGDDYDWEQDTDVGEDEGEDGRNDDGAAAADK